jgi:integrase
MASYQKTASGKVRVQVDVKGRRASETLPTMREARDWAREKEAELKAEVGGLHGKGKTLKDAFQRFAEEVAPTRRGEDKEIIRLAAFQKPAHGLPLSKPFADVNDEDIRAWRDRRLKMTKAGSVLRDMTLMAAVFEVARTEWKWTARNPVREVKKPPQPAHRTRVIKGPEIRNVLRALGYQPRGRITTVSQSVAVCFLLALSTGMRAKELCGLRWQDVREAYGTAHNVKARMEGVSRDVPFSPVARRLVARMEGWDAETVFGLSTSTLDALFRRARKRAGYHDFVFHDSRHTAATRIARSKKVDVLELCKMFGWKRMDQALTYFNPTAEQLAARL